MKYRSSKFLMPIFTIFFFVMTLFISSDFKVKAADSLDFYYPNQVVGKSYNSDGTINLNDNITVYFHNNGAGYVLDDDKLRISSITISNGSNVQTITSGYLYYAIVDYNALDRNVYGSNLPYSKLQGININLSSVFSLDSNINNTLSIRINLQQKESKWWGLQEEWVTYSFSSVNSYKGGVKQSSNTVGFNVSNSSFTNDKLIVENVWVSENVYNKKNLSDKSPLYLNAQVNFNFVGYLRVYYSASAYVNIYFNGGSTTSQVNLLDTGIFSDNNETTFIFNKFSVSNAKDRYGSTINNVLYSNKSTSVKLDTKKPTIVSAGVSTEGIKYDVSEFIVDFNFSETSTITISEVKFSIGGSDQIKTCDSSTQNCSATTTDGLSIKKSYDLSGNGAVLLIGFKAEVVDDAGNEIVYDYNLSKVLCTANKDVELVSSIQNVTSEKLYYYENETLVLNVELTNESVSFDDFSNVFASFYKEDGTEYAYKFTSYGKIENVISLNYVVDDELSRLSEIYFYKEGTDDAIYIQELNILLNNYLSLGLHGKEFNSPDYVKIYESQDTHSFDVNKISISVLDGAITTLNCNSQASIDKCEYSTSKDGSDYIKIDKGAIILTNGQKNNNEKLILISNFRAPNVDVSFDEDKFYLYEDINYYKDGSSIIEFDLVDGYAIEKCLYYKFNNDEYTKSCGENIKVSLPEQNGRYTISYYVSDGVNSTQSQLIDKTFEYRSEFFVGDILVEINDIAIDDSIENIDATKRYNAISIAYSGAKKLDLLNKLEIYVYSQSKIHYTSVEESANFQINTHELGNVDDVVKIEIVLTDQLTNLYVYDAYLNIDTLAPTFDTVVANTEKIEERYLVTISGYGDNKLEVNVAGENVALDGSSFITENERYTIVLTDAAGNTAQKIFTTIPPAVELNVLSTSTYNVKYEIYISPFESSIHDIEEYKYLVFEYMSEIHLSDLEVARNNVCTPGRRNNCYIIGSFNPYSNVINQTFDRGHTYILEIRINNVLATDTLTGNLPRIDILPADAVSPQGQFLDDDINPDYVSSTSGMNFEFKFLAIDANLTDSYYYMIVKSTLNSSINVSNFYQLYQGCYGASATNNGCAIKGMNEYDSLYDETANSYLGIVNFVANSNTRRRMENNVNYSLFVLLTDINSNSTLFKIREFKNVTKAADVEYLNDSNFYTDIEDGTTISTINSSIAKITSYNGIKIKSITLDGVAQSFNAISGVELSLGVGKRVIEVIDVLENKSVVTIYSATANSPIIEVYYNYDGEYYKILDNTLAYNSNNAGNVYVKVIGENLQIIKIIMNSSGDYLNGSEIFSSITDEDNNYGTSLLNIMQLHNGSLYSGDVTIRAINSRGGESSITLNVDNRNPVITLSMAGINVVNLLGEYYDLNINEGVYSLEYNYQRDITYQYLMNALFVNVDGIAFDDVIDNNRFKFKVNGSLISNYDEAISKGTKLITLDYFDNAGNSASTVKISVNPIDNEKPSITLNQALEVVELNLNTSLATIILSDNHDLEENLVLTAKINGNSIDYSNYLFDELGEYTIVYEVIDTSTNAMTIEQKVMVVDSRAPELKEGTVSEYTIGINKKLSFDIPTFIDSDPINSEYKPFEIKLYNFNNELMDRVASNYPLVIDTNILNFNFVPELGVGEYKVLFIVKDASNNAREETFIINVVDDVAPVLELKVNNKIVNDGATLNFSWGSDISIVAVADDEYLGNLNSRIVGKITYKGSIVDAIDTTKNGIYVLEYKVCDDNNNEAISTISVIIDKDEVAPVINKVLVNDIEISTTGMSKITGNSLTILVDSTDDYGVVSTTIKVNDKQTINAGQSFAIDADVSGNIYKLLVTIVDASGNATSQEYSIIVDNKLPQIAGFVNGDVYDKFIKISVSDENIKLIKIYKNGILDKQYTMNIYDLDISSEGMFTIVAEDTYGNIVTSVFAIIIDKSFNVVDDINNTSINYKYNYSSLLETRVDGNTLTFILNENPNIKNKDKLYILVNYPNSDYKYIAYSLDGNTYLGNDAISIDSIIIEGQQNKDLLEKIGDKYYAYVMVVSGDGIDVDEENKTGISNTLKSALIFVLVTTSICLLVYLIVKMRRKVRAV